MIYPVRYDRRNAGICGADGNGYAPGVTSILTFYHGFCLLAREKRAPFRGIAEIRLIQVRLHDSHRCVLLGNQQVPQFMGNG